MHNFEKRNIYAFICLIRNQPSLFANTKLNELYDKCASLEDNDKILSDAVSEWCQQSSNSQIHEEFGKQRRLLFGVPGDKRPPGTDKDYLPDIDIQSNKENLLNAIQQSFTPDTRQPSQSGQQSSTSNISQPPN
jgi:hypothetical protein